MKRFAEILENLAEFDEIRRGLSFGESPISVVGVSDAVRAHLAFSLCNKQKKKPFVVAANDAQARAIYEDLRFFYGDKVLFYPGRELMFYDIEAASNDIKKQRLNAIDKLFENRGEYAVVTTVSAMLNPSVPREVYKKRVFSINIDDEIDIDDLSSTMTEFGYKREDLVEAPGQYSIRGGIFDFFPFWSELPFRIEFFDTMVDSIRQFYPQTQRTTNDLGENIIPRITPVSEIVSDALMNNAVVSSLERKLRKAQGMEQTEEIQKLILILKKDIERIKEGISFPSKDKYIPEFYGRQIPTLLDYIDDNFIVFFDDPARIRDSIKGEGTLLNETIKDLVDRGIVPPMKMQYSLAFSDALKLVAEKDVISFCPLSNSNSLIKHKRSVNITAKSLNSYNGKMEFFYDALNFYQKNKYRIIILAGSDRKCENLAKQLENDGFKCTQSDYLDYLPKEGFIRIVKGSVSCGFEYPLIRTVVICDKEIFGSEKRKKRRFKVDKSNKIDSFMDLMVGDYVVHQNHGIGQYEGIQRLTVEGAQRDYLKIVYKDGDFLYVPTDQLGLIYKHSGSDGTRVRLNRLGGQDWNKAKQRVKDSCKDMAKELISLYAQRQAIKGIEFSKDTEWQRDFEAGFQFEETDDQLRCISEVKRDMEKPHPMERLLCGDVGYGKTEVAMRAAFKAVMDGYQVAYLVPTTILASQHYNTFRQRMKDYPVNICSLSRFSTPNQQKNIVKQLKNGEMDIVIGTHKILQKTIEFKKLGLLIIDEEQRFGVGHKERIKEMKKEIDVLTLSATPIPRTLHMSMTGIRDMSIIAQPPEDRYPVSTYVMEYDEDIIREAILKELDRGGQVYYLHNRVMGIEKKALEIQKLLPEAKVSIAHGQMSERELEGIMMDMADGAIDVLVCTTIIETGLDIPNVNTIIIEDADRLGLAQLYQLRGRVGRSNRLAYSYLTYRKDKVIGEDAQKRLKAIREFTEFGSGFKIAMRDLEIRGTGNVIGPQQSGHMESVGYEMYCKLLAESVNEMQGNAFKKDVETSVDLPLNAFIPDRYISAHSQRIMAYKKIAAIENTEDLGDVYDELLDRYGDVPKPVSNLMEIALIRKMASDRKLTEVKGDRTSITMMFDPEDAPDLCGLLVEDDFKEGRIQFKNGKKPKILYKMPNNVSTDQYILNVKKIIEKI